MDEGAEAVTLSSEYNDAIVLRRSQLSIPKAYR